MRLSEGVEWAAHCVVLLAGLPEDTTMPAALLAEYHGVPGPYLAKSLQALMRAGVVTSVPGRHGGYRLTRAADEISLLDVVDAVEGGEPIFRCTEIRRRGPSAVGARFYSPRCAIAAAMDAAEDAWRKELASISIGAIAARVLDAAPPRAVAKATVWLTDQLEQRS